MTEPGVPTSQRPSSVHVAAVRVRQLLSNEVTGGILLLGATVLALILANSQAADHYFGFRETYVGPVIGPLDLKMSLAHWAADGLLAVFFFIVGLELKRELLDGELRDLRKAALAVSAAAGGIITPAVIYIAMNAGDREAVAGWAIPAAFSAIFHGAFNPAGVAAGIAGVIVTGFQRAAFPVKLVWVRPPLPTPP